MGLFDKSSSRSRKPSAETAAAAKLQRRQNDAMLAASLGLDDDFRGTRPQSKPSSERIRDEHRTPQVVPSGLVAQRDTMRRSKLERMMGSDVPLPDLSYPNAKTLRGSTSASSMTHDQESTYPSHQSMRHRGSLSTLSDHSSTPSRAYDRSIVNLALRPDVYVGASTTFTEMAEADCPVCLEPLSYRLAGEKPHVVPTCGHALHNACFTAVYGPPEAVLAAQEPKDAGTSRIKGAGSASRQAAANPPGMCGVCRRPITLGTDDSASKSHKLTGQGRLGVPADSVTIASGTASDRSVSEAQEDDPVDTHPKGRPSGSFGPITNPVIRARPEYNTIYRKANGKDNGKLNVVCALSVEVPSRRSPTEIPEHSLSTIDDQRVLEEEEAAEEESRHEIEDSYSDDLKQSGASWAYPAESGSSQAKPVTDSPAQDGTSANGDKREAQPASDQRKSSSEEGAGFSFSATPAAPPHSEANQAVLEDLSQRISDWKGHSLEHFGPLILHDLLSVRQDTVVREFHVYLFQEALLCVTEEKKKGLSRFIATATTTGPNGPAEPVPASKPALKLKGRIYLRHIRRVIDSSVAGELSISITMDDDNLDQFVLCFRERETLSVWKNRLSEMVEARKSPSTDSIDEDTAAKSAIEAASVAHSAANHAQPEPSSNTLGPQGQKDTAVSRTNSLAASTHSYKTGSQNGLSPAVLRSAKRLSNVSSIKSNGSIRSRSSVISESIPLYQQWSASGGLDPRLPPPPMLPHTPIDLVLMVSVPTVLPEHTSGSINSSSALKLRLVRSTLEFVVSRMGPHDRVSLVAYSVGVEGEVRRTGLLNPHRVSSRRLLEEFIQGLGRPWDTHSGDPFRLDLDKLGGSSERTDSVTAVNVGLDVVLQRKTKNPVTGMIMVNDTADGPKRQQMDLVMARAEAANVPIHCFGYGKMHDPSSLWLISNNTRGSYTFVREWFQLRECLTGCIGSIMSIALTDVRLHLAVPHDNCFRVKKIAGMPGAVISSSGKDVDIEMGDLRFGDSRELLVELEVNLDELLPQLAGAGGANRNSMRKPSGPAIEQGSATDDFMRRLGIQNLSLAGADDNEGTLEHFIDEVPVFEADAAFKDPANNTSTSRLANPTILTVEVDTHSPDPLSSGPPGMAAAMAEPTVTRRRLEVLVSEMITRSLLLVSSKNHVQAQKLLEETHRIIDTVVQAIPPSAAFRRKSAIANSRSNARRQRDAQNRKTLDSLLAMMNDLDTLIDGLEPQNRSAFERDGRNFGAQQAMILRDQKAWTTRSDTEYLNFRDDNAATFAAHGAAFASAR